MRFLRFAFAIACVGTVLCSGQMQKPTSTLAVSPASFEPNRGQATADVAYIVDQRHYRVLISANAVTYVIPNSRDHSARHVRIRWVGQEGTRHFVPSKLMEARSNYLIGSDPSRWITEVPHYAELRENSFLPGIDLVYHASKNGQLEYDLLVAPHSDIDTARFVVEGADSAAVLADGTLNIQSGDTSIRQLPPHAFQLIGSRKASLPARYVFDRNGEISIAVSARDASLPLVIDPVLQYATYLGGATISPLIEGLASNYGQGVAVDPAGNFFISGLTTAIDFPVTQGAFQTSCPKGGIVCGYVAAAFVTKFSRAGQLLYSTYLSGNEGVGASDGRTLAVDKNGIAYITGGIVGNALGGFPTTATAYQRECNSANGGCAFLAKLNAAGSALLYSTLFGGVEGTYRQLTVGHALAIGQNGDIYLTGSTSDPTLPTTPGAHQETCPLQSDGSCLSAFAARINTKNAGQSSLVFATYLGAPGGQSNGRSIAVDRYGDAYVLANSTVDVAHVARFGSGMAPWYVCNRGANTSPRQPCESFIAKLSGLDGHELRAATLLGGAAGAGIAIDALLNSYVVGAAISSFPTTTNAAQRTFGGGETDAFATKLNASGNALLFSTFLGGSGIDVANDVAINTSGMPFITGWTNSGNFPLGPGAFRTSGALTQAGFVSALNGSGGLYYSSYLGGSDLTTANRIALDPAWNAYVAGDTIDVDFPATANAFQRHLAGSTDAFVAKVVIAGDLSVSFTASPKTLGPNVVALYRPRVFNNGPDGSDNVVLISAIPRGMALVSASQSGPLGCTHPAIGATSGTIACRQTRLEAKQEFIVYIYLKAIGPVGTSVTTRASVSAQTQDLSPGNNSASTTAVIQ